MASSPRLLANYKGDNDIKLGTVHISQMKTTSTRKETEECATSHHLKWGHLHPNDFSSNAQDIREIFFIYLFL